MPICARLKYILMNRGAKHLWFNEEYTTFIGFIDDAT